MPLRGEILYCVIHDQRHLREQNVATRLKGHNRGLGLHDLISLRDQPLLREGGEVMSG